MTDSSSLIKAAQERADTDPLKITIRELLDAWGAKRRGYWVVSNIEYGLKSAGLITSPSFKDGWIDNRVSIVRAPTVESTPEPVPVTSLEEVLIPRAMLRVDDLSSAHADVEFIDMNGSITTAKSQMLRHDYSQLAVTSGARTLRGAVTWESIAVAGLRGGETALKDAIIPTEAVSLNRDVLELIPRIADEGFVFVVKNDGTLSGIVTAADLSLEFLSLARPYLLLGEIERRLRRLLDEKIPVQVLERSARPGDDTREIQSASDLTFGEYVRILEYGEHWDLLNWEIDQKVFIRSLNEVKDLRNDVMHFSPDPFGDEELQVLRNFIRMLRALDPRP